MNMWTYLGTAGSGIKFKDNHHSYRRNVFNCQKEAWSNFDFYKFQTLDLWAVLELNELTRQLGTGQDWVA